MKVSHVSSHWISQSLRHRLSDLQLQLNKASTEVSTGKFADAGLELGEKSSSLVSVSSKVDQLEAITQTNKLASNRLGVIQQNLQLIDSVGSELFATIATANASGADPQLAVDAANIALQRTTDLLNTTYDGVYVFAGQNTSNPPIAQYEGGAAQTAFANAFVTHFGFAQTAPAAQNISAAAMTTFLDTVVEPMFTGAAWNTDWSSATDEGMISRISENQLVETSSSVNEMGLRNQIMAGVVSSELFGSNLNKSALDSVTQFSLDKLGTAAGQISTLQGRIGFVEQRVSDSSEQIQLQRDQFILQAGDLENVDPFEATTRAQFLLTQIEMSYSITSRINNLSLMRFIQ